MSWLTLRQYRVQLAVVVTALVAIAIVLAITGPHLVHVNDTYLATCKANHDCSTTNDPVVGIYNQLQQILNAIALMLPVLLGVFWGAPLIARELETGSHRLAWTQSVTRLRWVTVKLGIMGLASVAVAGLYSLMVTWWSSPIDQGNMNRFATGLFAERGITPMGYAAFAFAFGVLAGVLIRRTVPAMAATLVAVVVSRYALDDNVRPHLMSPLRLALSNKATQIIGIQSNFGGTTSVQASQPSLPNAWVYSENLVNSAGQSPSQSFLKKACPTPNPSSLGGGSSAVHRGVSTSRHHSATFGGQNAMQSCSNHVAAKFHAVVTYQPISRYWDFQILETALYVVLALILAGASIWWVNRRLS